MGSVVSGIIGQESGRKDQNKAASYLQEGSNLWRNLEIPTIESQELNLLLPEYMGDFQALQEAVYTLGPSAMEDVQVDPRLAEAQMNALLTLEELGETGLTPAEAAALRQARRSAAGEAEAKSQQILQEMARRGMGGSGMELAARLQSAQSSADRQSQESDRLMQIAQQRALDAMSQAGNLATGMRSQSFGEQSDVARARDLINQFNVQNQQNVQQRNVANTNQANLRNLQEQQRLSEAGTAIKNAQQQYNKELQQQKFQNEVTRAQGLSGQLSQQAQFNQDKSKRTADAWAAGGQAVDKILFGGDNPLIKF